MIGALLLVVTWLSAWFAARAVLRFAAPDHASLPVSLVFSAGLLAAVPGQVCRLVGDLRASMGIATGVFVLVILASWWRARARTDAGTGAGTSTSTGGGAPRPAWPAWMVSALGLLCVAHGAVNRNFFDEEHHVPMAMVIARGVVPPEHPLLPGQVIPYHWGVDALYAQLVVAGLRPDAAIDVVTIASFALLLLAAALIGTVLAGRAGATLAVILAPLAGSPLAHPLHDGMGVLDADRSLLPAAWAEWFRRPPPITADFFQHPQGLAFSLVLVVLVLFCAHPVEERSVKGARAVGAALLAMLSLVQAVHFLVVGFGLTVATTATVAKALFTREDRAAAWRAAGIDLALLAAAFAMAVAFGGFFSPGAGTSSSLVWGSDFFGDASMGMRVVHHAAVFGLPLLLLPFLPFALLPSGHAPGRLEIALVAGAAVGFFLPNVVVYKSSWDIVKLYSAGGFLAGVALAGTFARWLSMEKVAAHKGRRRAALSLVVVLTALTIEFPLVWMATRTVLQGRLDVPRKNDFRPNDDLLEVGRAVWPYVGARDNVLVGSHEVGRMNGLMTPGFDARRAAAGHILDFGRVRKRMTLRQEAIRSLHPQALEALEIRWVLLSDREIERLSAVARAALARLEPQPISHPGWALYRVPR